MPVHPARRVSGDAPRIPDRGARGAGHDVRGVSGAGAGSREVETRVEIPAAKARAASRPLPSESVCRHARSAKGARTGSGAGGEDRGVLLLRHGGRIRLRGRALRRLDENGRGLVAAGGAGELAPGLRTPFLIVYTPHVPFATRLVSVIDDGIAAPTAWAPTLIPEPGTYAMMLAGLGLMGFVARRRRGRNTAAV